MREDRSSVLGQEIVACAPYAICEVANHMGSWEQLSAWLCDERVSRFYGGESHRYSPREARAHYQPYVERHKPVQACFLVLEERPVGYLQFYEVDDAAEYQLPREVALEDVWALDLFIGEPELWGKGHGRAFIKLLLSYLFEARGARRVLIDPAERNTRAIRAYEACGFKVVKRLTAHEEHDGVMQDCLLMCAQDDAEGLIFLGPV